MRLLLASIALGTTLATPAHAAPGYEWVQWKGKVPANAVQGGVDFNGSTPLHVCRTYHINGLHPGKLLHGRCHIGWGGKEVIATSFEVLVAGDKSGSKSRRKER